jgi:alkylation response protein AidB-like acyl-CoA dehydrogenase
MDFQFSDEQISIKNAAKQFATQEMAPYAAEWDEQHIFPVEVLRKLAQLGFAGVYVRPESGGTGLSRIDAAIVFEELAHACPSTAAYLSIHNMVAWMIDCYGTPEQCTRWLPTLLTMQSFASYCLTEPDAGSDAAALKTTAKREGDYYIVNGAKAFISGGSTSDVYCCMVRTGEAGAKGITCLLIEKNTPGLSFGKPEKKLGWNSQCTTMVYFENCKIPVAHRLGTEGQGFKIALSGLNGGRINIAACSVGGAAACMQLTRRYLHERSQFGHLLQDFQALQFRLADMMTELEAARLMVYRGAAAIDQQEPEVVMYCAMAKRFATDIGFDICNQALQLHGGYGYLREYPIQRYFRDLRVHQILEGTNEIMRVIIAKRLVEKFEE